MFKHVFYATAILLSVTAPAFSEEIGSASGKGVISRFIPNDPNGNTEDVRFLPLYSFAYTEGSGEKASTWIMLTDKQPPIEKLLSAADRDAARIDWCKTENASFVTVKLDANSAVDLYFLCPGDGTSNTEMLSTINGLDSVVVKFDLKTGVRLKGSITGGEGNCPGEDGKSRYCTQKSDYTFDAPIVGRKS